jgi:hypothetical protein
MKIDPLPFAGLGRRAGRASTAIVGRGRLVNSTGPRMRLLDASIQGTPPNYVIVAFQKLGHASPGPKVALREIGFINRGDAVALSAPSAPTEWTLSATTTHNLIVAGVCGGMPWRGVRPPE